MRILHTTMRSLSRRSHYSAPATLFILGHIGCTLAATRIGESQFRRANHRGFDSVAKLIDYRLLAIVGNHHFLLALPLIRCARKSLTNATFFAVYAILTITTLVAMYGSLGFSLAQVEHLVPVLHSSNNQFTALIMKIHSSDEFITIGSFANILAMVLLAIAVIRFRIPRTGGGGKS